MKELIHFTLPGSTVCDQMKPVIAKVLDRNKDIKYSVVDVSTDEGIYEFYNKKYPMPICPSFISVIDGSVHDGHMGYASEMILESLFN